MLLNQIGVGKVREVLVDFYDRVFGDVMIGYLFEGKSKTRLVEKECELTAMALGGAVAYTGRPLNEVHRPLRIVGGHFDRRLQILRETLSDHRIPNEVGQAWIDHTLSLRTQVIAPDDADCHAAPPRTPPEIP